MKHLLKRLNTSSSTKLFNNFSFKQISTKNKFNFEDPLNIESLYTEEEIMVNIKFKSKD